MTSDFTVDTSLYLLDSISESNALTLLSSEDKSIYSVGISTAGFAEMRMAKKLPNSHIIATTIDPIGELSARDLIKNEKLSDKIQVKLENVSRPLPYQEAFFDFVYARLVLHYLSKKDLEKALQELYRVLKKDGKIFVVVRSKDCKEALGSSPDPETGMTTYASKDNQVRKRHFHDESSISCFLRAAGFHISHIKTYEEQLCSDFQRKKPSQKMDSLIEVYASKDP